MATFVLVHGMWHDAWWRSRLRDILLDEGHDVFTPTLTGVGERSHLLTQEIDLETHVLDVANLLHWEDLNDSVLMGHSYAGCVVSQVADRIPERIRSLVYLDAVVPENGKSLFDHLPDKGERARKAAKEHGHGFAVPSFPASAYNLKRDADVDLVDRKCTMHPIATVEGPARISGAIDSIANTGFILAGEFGSPLHRPFYDDAEKRGWRREELPCGHEIMLDMPEDLAKLLVARC
jgi:pimeloyl-ACP methyl ester carboxylesterase